jgi:hypothetical protein
MAVSKRAKAKTAAPSAPSRYTSAHKTQISLMIQTDMLDRVNAVAERKAISRAALLTLWIGDKLEQEGA